MVKSEVIIDEKRCRGCGFCVQFCPRQCLVTIDREEPLDKSGFAFGASGFGSAGAGSYGQPILARPELCNTCGACARICPHWAVQVNLCFEEPGQAVTRERVAGPPRLAPDPPLAGCPGCQHPTVGRLVAEALDEMGLGDRAVMIEAIPCSVSSAFGPEVGYKLTQDEKAPDLASALKRDSPDAIVVAVQGQWGLGDFSFDINSFTGALIRGEKFTTILCNMAYWGPKEGRPVPVSEDISGRLEPTTRFMTPDGEKLVKGGYPLHIAELAATFPGVAYSARGAITSIKDYQLTKGYIKNALRKQRDRAGSSFVEILCVCGDTIYSPMVDCLRWVKGGMAAAFPLGEFKNLAQAL